MGTTSCFVGAAFRFNTTALPAGAPVLGAPSCANPQKALAPITNNTNTRIVFIAFLSPCLSRLNYRTFDQLTFVT